jgi:hypothetical protein
MVRDSTLQQTWKGPLVFLRICPPQSRHLRALGQRHKRILDSAQQLLIGGKSLPSRNSPGSYYFKGGRILRLSNCSDTSQACFLPILYQFFRNTVGAFSPAYGAMLAMRLKSPPGIISLL